MRALAGGSSPLVLVLFTVLVLIQACVPRRPYRPALPPPAAAPPVAAREMGPVPAPPTPETRPELPQARIREENLRDRPSAPQAKVPDQRARPIAGRETTPSAPDEISLIAKISPKTPPQRAAALRLTEEGKKLLEAGDYPKALARLEKTIAIDATNPYGYYYLAKAHYQMNRYQESLNFLDVAESYLSNETPWLAEVYALRGENFRALGLLQRAESNYGQALRLNPGNRTAAEGLNLLRGEPQPSLR